MKKNTIKSFVGGHPIYVFAGCEFDPETRKYKGGHKIAEIPYSGRMLSAVFSQESDEDIEYNGVFLPTKTTPKIISVDEIPSEDECDLCIVSATYASACKSFGKDTSRLLTIGDAVVDEKGRLVGTINLYRN